MSTHKLACTVKYDIQYASKLKHFQHTKNVKTSTFDASIAINGQFQYIKILT